MEDSHVCKDDLFNDKTVALYCVLDGHGGPNVVQYVEKVLIRVFSELYFQHKSNLVNIFKPLFVKIDAQLALVGAGDQGSTICLVIVRQEQNKRMCYVSNLGDTRAVSITRNFQVKRESYDHKATDPDEVKRIQNAGGTILNNRVDGKIAITRTLGDLSCKSPNSLIIDPYVNYFEITQNHQYLIVASDGLFDVIQDHEIPEQIENTSNTKTITEKLVQYALTHNSMDNISVLAIKF